MCCRTALVTRREVNSKVFRIGTHFGMSILPLPCRLELGWVRGVALSPEVKGQSGSVKVVLLFLILELKGGQQNLIFHT